MSTKPPRLTPAEFQRTVQVLCVPEENEHPHVVPPGQTFWLHTSGLRRFGHPELEMVNVPLVGIRVVHMTLNAWGYYSICERAIGPGERLHEAGWGLSDVLLTAEPSVHPFWSEDPRRGPCLRLRIDGAVFACESCEQEEHEHEVPAAAAASGSAATGPDEPA